MEEETCTAPGQHSHCIQCCKVECTQFADMVIACAVLSCEQCGWKCHQCKLDEHRLNCPEEKVACINKEYGCPLLMKRSKVASHLATCPASVVVCVEEWSRWPMYDKKGGQRLSLPPNKTYFDCGQLDVGLAMRDQRMLMDSLQAPNKLRHTLRNPLTKKYPVMPFPHHSSSMDSEATTSEGTAHTLSDDESDTPWDLLKSQSHPGLESSICSQLFRVSREVTDSMVAALTMTADYLAQPPRTCLTDSVEETGDHIDPSFRSFSPEVNIGNSCPVSNDNKLVGDRSDPSHHLAKSDDCLACGMQHQSEERCSHVSGSGIGSRQSLKRSIRSSILSDNFSGRSTTSRSVLRDIGGTQLHKITGQAVNAEGDIHLHKLLGVNLGVELISRYIDKPRNMYSFTCAAQNFRRDQIRWHAKNVHQDIYQGLNGWLLHRCPLAYLGCTFFFQRLTPAQPQGTVYHSWLQESFGFHRDVPILPATLRSESNIEVGPKSPPSGESSTSKEVEICSTDEHINSSAVQQPSLSDLEKFDINFFDDCSVQNRPDEDKVTLLCNDFPGKADISMSGSQTDSADCPQPSEKSPSSLSANPQPMSERVDGSKLSYLNMRPVLYTAYNWDSKVLFQYDVEEEAEEDIDSGPACSLMDLPLEILQSIARHLDSFSMCNLSLTSHLLRDVCCSLLEEQGIVVLQWERQKTKSEVNWKVVNKRWMFSTSFEPILSWKFTDGHMTIGDHLKVCPYNKVVRHSCDRYFLQGMSTENC